MKRTLNPAAAAVLLLGDLAARLFCLSVFWMILIIAVLCGNAALYFALSNR